MLMILSNILLAQNQDLKYFEKISYKIFWAFKNFLNSFSVPNLFNIVNSDYFRKKKI